jgi:sec-independent protein translocase protein TatB
MFDVGFSELVVIGVVALIVIGPERLPKVARMAGHLLGRLQRYVNDVKADINREMELEEMKKLHTQFQDAAREVETSVNSELHSTEQALNNAVEGKTETTISAAAADGSASAAPVENSIASEPVPPVQSELPLAAAAPAPVPPMAGVAQHDQKS